MLGRQIAARTLGGCGRKPQTRIAHSGLSHQGHTRGCVGLARPGFARVVGLRSRERLRQADGRGHTVQIPLSAGEDLRSINTAKTPAALLHCREGFKIYCSKIPSICTQYCRQYCMELNKPILFKENWFVLFILQDLLQSCWSNFYRPGHPGPWGRDPKGRSKPESSLESGSTKLIGKALVCRGLSLVLQ